LVTAAAQQDPGSPPNGPSNAEIVDWVARLSPSEKDGLVVRLLSGDAHPSSDISDLRRRFQKEWNEKNASRISVADQTPRTAAEILDIAGELAEEESRREAERRACEEIKRKREAEAERKRYLKALAPKADKIWGEVESLLRTTNQKNYDQAVQWLRDLRDLATTLSSDSKSWEERVTGLRLKHSRKPSLMKRFDKAGFP
jgi:hypothetical protein